jgi:hypothetical protein
VFTAICGVTRPLLGVDESTSAEIQSPVGVWGCVLYEQHTSDNDYVLMRFEPNGTTHFARSRGDAFRIWAPVSSWTARRNRLSFEDSRSGRKFEADLRRSGFGGIWKTEISNGGWWCARLDDAYAVWRNVESLNVNDVMPPLLIHGTSTPFYPLSAIRRAKEGHAAVCFLVKSTGAITDPEVIVLSDEIFRETTLRAVLASSYHGWAGEPAVRPGCRTFDFELGPIG